MDSTICPSPQCRGASVLLAEFLYHLRHYHSEEALKLFCPLCDSKHLKPALAFKGLESHWYRHHRKYPKPMKISQLPAAVGQATETKSVSALELTGPNEPADAVDPQVKLDSEPADAVCPQDTQDSEEAVVFPPEVNENSEPAAVSSQVTKDTEQTSVVFPCVDKESERPSVVPLPLNEIIDTNIPTEQGAHESDQSVSVSSSGGHSISVEAVTDVYEETDVILSDSDPELGDSDDSVSGNDSVSGDDCDSELTNKEHISDCTEKGLEFLMTLKTECGVNKTQLKSVHSETKTLMDLVCTSTIKKLGEAGIPLDKVNVEKIKESVFGKFGNFKSTYLLEQQFQKNSDTIMPKFILVDREFRRVGVGKKLKTVVAPTNFYYVPILSVLEKLLQHPDYKAISNRSVSSDPNILDCFMKGNFAKENPVLMRHPNALRVIFYYDDVEACSDLSSRSSGNQKLGAFYLTLDNIHPKYRANLNTICLVALADASFFKGPGGVDFVLERFRKDLEKLENGVILNGELTYGTLIACIGDNLALHLLGGFKCGFTANWLCRTCKATLPEVRSLVEEDPLMLRQVAEYESQVKEIEEAATLKQGDLLRTKYGINKNCPLNSLTTFHVVSGLPPDLMHDILEGTLSRALKNIIKYCVDVIQVVTLQWLNEALKDFDYGFYKKTTKPSRIKPDHLKEDGNLRQSSSQTRTLATILPLILGPHINEHDAHWKNFTLLLEIVRMIFSDSINKNLLPHLASMIATFLTGQKNLYGHLYPKDHFMTHYPRFLLMYGSLIDFNCMRMETNHKFLKKHVYCLGNYKNIPKSLAVTYQTCQGLKWKKPFIRGAIYGVLKRLTVNQLPYGALIKGSGEVVESSWAKTDGFHFRREESYICLGTNSEGCPCFSRVQHIIVWPEFLLVCLNVRTEFYNAHLSAYKITDLENFVFHQVRQIKGKRLFQAHFVGKDKYIALKECVEESF